MKKRNIPSAHHPLNEILGGFAPGTLTVVRSLDDESEWGNLQDLIIEETQRLAFDKVPTLFISLKMTEMELCKELITDTSKERPEILPEDKLKLLDESQLYVMEKKDLSLKNLPDNILPFPGKNQPRVVIIDSIDEVVPEQNIIQEGITFVNRLIESAKKEGCCVILTDYANLLETGYPRRDEVTEIDLKTTLEGIVQAQVVNNKVFQTIPDIHQKTVMEIPVKPAKTTS